MSEFNFLKSYLQYNEGNEVNPEYHLWTALSVLSSCVSRKVWVDMGYFRIFPNLYTVLLGPAGNGKTTAMAQGLNMCLDIGNIPCGMDCQSVEDLVRGLAKDTAQQAVMLPGGEPLVYTHLSLFVTELTQLIGIDPEKMLDFFVTIYDKDEKYTKGTIKHGTQTIIRPCVNLLACTVPDCVARYLKQDVITGGFSRRCAFIVEDWSLERRVPRPCVTPVQHACRKDCVEWGQQLKSVIGPFTWDPDAIAWYDNWYLTRKIAKDPNVAPFDKTKSTLMIKLAMLLQLGRSLERRITTENIQLALALTDKVIGRLPEVFGAIGRNELAQVSSKLLSILQRNGAPTPEKELVAVMWRDATISELMSVIQHLIDQGQLVRIPPKDGVSRTFLALPDQMRPKTPASQPATAVPDAPSTSTPCPAPPEH